MKIIEFVIKHHPIWVTFGYLGLLAGVFFKYMSSGASLSLNELGDFLAGAFAPLAFFWLVRGYFQQARAIEIQSGELKAAVEQHVAQVDATLVVAETETRKLRIEYYKSVSETGQIIANCQSELGLGKKRREDARLFVSGNWTDHYLELMTRIASSVSSFAGRGEKDELKERYKKLFAEQNSIQEEIQSSSTIGFAALEERYREIVSLNGRAQLLLKDTKEFNRKEEKKLAERVAKEVETQSSLDQSPF